MKKKKVENLIKGAAITGAALGGNAVFGEGNLVFAEEMTQSGATNVTGTTLAPSGQEVVSSSVSAEVGMQETLGGEVVTITEANENYDIALLSVEGEGAPAAVDGGNTTGDEGAQETETVDPVTSYEEVIDTSVSDSTAFSQSQHEVESLSTANSTAASTEYENAVEEYVSKSEAVDEKYTTDEERALKDIETIKDKGWGHNEEYTQALVKYELVKKGIPYDSIKTEWVEDSANTGSGDTYDSEGNKFVDTHGNRDNYMYATYVSKDSAGNNITVTEYYDYVWKENEIYVVKKEVKFDEPTETVSRWDADKNQMVESTELSKDEVEHGNVSFSYEYKYDDEAGTTNLVFNIDGGKYDTADATTVTAVQNSDGTKEYVIHTENKDKKSVTYTVKQDNNGIFSVKKETLIYYISQNSSGNDKAYGGYHYLTGGGGCYTAGGGTGATQYFVVQLDNGDYAKLLTPDGKELKLSWWSEDVDGYYNTSIIQDADGNYFLDGYIGPFNFGHVLIPLSVSMDDIYHQVVETSSTQMTTLDNGKLTFVNKGIVWSSGAETNNDLNEYKSDIASVESMSNSAKSMSTAKSTSLSTSAHEAESTSIENSTSASTSFAEANSASAEASTSQSEFDASTSASTSQSEFDASTSASTSQSEFDASTSASTSQSEFDASTSASTSQSEFDASTSASTSQSEFEASTAASTSASTEASTNASTESSVNDSQIGNDGFGGGTGMTTSLSEGATPLAADTTSDQGLQVADQTNDGLTAIAPDQVPLAVIQDDEDLTEIEDEETPLAFTQEELQRAWWYWILIVIGLVTGKTTYDKKKKRFVFIEKDDETK